MLLLSLHFLQDFVDAMAASAGVSVGVVASEVGACGRGGDNRGVDGGQLQS